METYKSVPYTLTSQENIGSYKLYYCMSTLCLIPGHSHADFILRVHVGEPFYDNHSTEPSHFEHFITCHTPFVSSDFIVVLIKESRYFLHAKYLLYPVSFWPSPLLLAISFTMHLLYTSCYAMASYASTFEPWTACVEFCGTRSVLAWGMGVRVRGFFNHVCCVALCPHSQLWGTTYWYCKYWQPVVVTIFVVSYCPSLVNEALLIATFVGVHKMLHTSQYSIIQ